MVRCWFSDVFVCKSAVYLERMNMTGERSNMVCSTHCNMYMTVSVLFFFFHFLSIYSDLFAISSEIFSVDLSI